MWRSSDSTAARRSSGCTDQVREVLADSALTSVFQPIVDIATGRLVAVEALVRGPQGPLVSPDALFAAARDEDLLVELDWACRGSALRSALACGLPKGVALFVNVEPATLGGETPAELAELESEACARFDVVLELTERELVRRPADVLAAVRRARAQGWRIALDDVGVEPASLALMPVLRPDVVKLDMSLIQGRTTIDEAQVVGAVGSYAEESGATILAEGIEDATHLERAVVAGATLGQGWHFGRPGLLAQLGLEGAAVAPTPLGVLPSAPRVTPFELLGGGLPLRQGRKSQLLATSFMLERQALEQPIAPLLLSTFQDAQYVTPATRRRYRDYARACPLVAMFAMGLTEEPAPGVRGAALLPSDPLTDEWVVAVLTPHYAAALIARDLGDDPHDEPDRRFEFAVTYDRRKVTAAATCLMDRIAPDLSAR